MRRTLDPPSPSRPRRAHVTGQEMIRWFLDHGWRASAPETGRHAFIDEMPLPGLLIRRIWHTPVVMHRDEDANGTDRTLWLQVHGSSTVRDADGASATLVEQDAFAWTGRSIAALESRQPAARIEIDFRTPAVHEDRIRHLPTRDTALQTVWSCVTGAVNVILNADTPLDDRTSRLLSHALLTLTDALYDPPDTASPGETADIAQAARRCIAQNAADPTFTIERAAKELGISRSHLTRVLTARGESARGLLRDARRASALRALAADPTADLVVVARNSGFPSARALRDALKSIPR